ncbi:5965_t:CDS:2 [Gigaspora margarita]|uniref:glutathione-specific gamma-glutamylcyclotransferase n=1 Tax=Gigaspora margarita TaxID=4874 RepID=A0ABN7VJM1_GIGMA|nr:5965_t:CDS:2 [Gigaspora margarita]
MLSRTAVQEHNNKDTEYWVFGYGSLIWKPPPVYEERTPGFIKGHVRRFWQHSTDHRGTVESPGRVVTLIPVEEWKLMEDYHDHKDGITWGVAYKINEKDVEKIKEYLDYREKCGYTIHYADVYQLGHDEPIVKNAVVYIATTKNESYIGPASLESMALQIHQSVGPSGPNNEYLFNLASALRELAPDAHDIILNVNAQYYVSRASD